MLSTRTLVNPWGLSSSPTSPIWVADNNAGVSTLYNGAGQQGLTVQIQAPDGGPRGTPTGTVFNSTSDFLITKGTKTASTLFLFATEDGTLSFTVDLFNPIQVIDNSKARDSAGDVGAVYKGLTNGSVGTNNYLYAANFRFGTVDVFNGAFHQVTWSGAFTDSSLPSGFAPFGIQNIGGLIYVTYALQNAQQHDDVKGPGNGFVDIYTTSGALVRRFASGGSLNSPWGLAAAPATFGNFHDNIRSGTSATVVSTRFRRPELFVAS
jgi:uncharacterized protein (TIGR03118 family)